jgi:uncharacterized protein (TIGR02246 family)
MRALIEELVSAWLANDALRACAFFAPDGVYHESGRAPIVGREAIFAHFQRFFRDGPPWRFEVDDVLVEGDRAAVAYRFATKNATGDWQERAGCALVRRAGGLIEEWREYHG